MELSNVVTPSDIASDEATFTVVQATGVGSPHKTALSNGTSPEADAGLVSKILFNWLTPLFRLSKMKRKEGMELESDDLWQLPDRDATKQTSAKFQDGWEQAETAFRLRREVGSVNSKSTVVKATNHNRSPPLSQGLSKLEAYNTMISALWKVGDVDMKHAAWLKLVSTLFLLTMPVLLNLVLQFLQDASQGDVPTWQGFALVAAIAFSMIFQIIADNA
jgi:hypothetical protein